MQSAIFEFSKNSMITNGEQAIIDDNYMIMGHSKVVALAAEVYS